MITVKITTIIIIIITMRVIVIGRHAVKTGHPCDVYVFDWVHYNTFY